MVLEHLGHLSIGHLAIGSVTYRMHVSLESAMWGILNYELALNCDLTGTSHWTAKPLASTGDRLFVLFRNFCYKMEKKV